MTELESSFEERCPGPRRSDERVHDDVVPLAAGIGLVKTEPIAELPSFIIDAGFVMGIDPFEKTFEQFFIAHLAGQPGGQAGCADVISVRLGGEAHVCASGPLDEESVGECAPDVTSSIGVEGKEILDRERERGGESGRVVDREIDVSVHEDSLHPVVEPHDRIGKDPSIPPGEHRPGVRSVHQIVESQTETRFGQSQGPELVNLTTQPP